ncbi:MAG: hypothetical protein SFZ03_09580 [Candidatus Melainabacteria bacterium]|nr:hypothetical protein [Candidatus Melainabacteria bacterium]
MHADDWGLPLPLGQRHNRRRWYDRHPTVSMAVSLLRAAPMEEQAQVAELLYHLVSQVSGCRPLPPASNSLLAQFQGWLQATEAHSQQRRETFHPAAEQLLGWMKHQPEAVQVSLAQQLLQALVSLGGTGTADPFHPPESWLAELALACERTSV